MFGIGWSEMLVIVVVALVLFGPKELPQVARSVGGFMRQFRRFISDAQRQFNEALREVEREIDLEEARKAAKATEQTASPQASGNTDEKATRDAAKAEEVSASPDKEEGSGNSSRSSSRSKEPRPKQRARSG